MSRALSPRLGVPDCIGAILCYPHEGEAVWWIRALSRRTVTRMKGRVHPVVYFIGKRTMTLAILRGARMACWGAQLESFLPENPLLGLGLLSHMTGDLVDAENKPAGTFSGHLLWIKQGTHEEVWMWRDGEQGFSKPDLEVHIDSSFLDWHKARIRPGFGLPGTSGPGAGR